ncbi:MAG TPA: SPFH domain-containing protein [Defluviitaleaceae bacterium]|nr:SPFH domain-containing protein [Defluviitaleaceae bacterium]HPT75726.1 SPFH domain-containing protein [Defluviitaleaceae bacterium]
MEEKILKAKAGMPCLILFIFLYLAAIASIIFGGNLLSKQNNLGAVFLTIGIIWVSIGFVPFLGLKIIKPQEALVLTLFGNYIGTLKEAGFFFVNPFAVAVNPAAKTRLGQSDDVSHIPSIKLEAGINLQNNYVSKKISLKVMTLNNKKQKINDALGNPIEIGVAVIWRVVDTAKAVFNVDNYKEYLSLQCDGALREAVRMYPYDIGLVEDNGANGEADEFSLRGSSKEVAQRIRETIQAKVENAGIEILEARITHLAYAPEIAAAMLQRQQARAIIDARKMIVDGAVGMVEMALEMLNEKQVIQLDEERKAAMVSNLLVVLCGNRDAQPVINSGSLY